MDSVWYKLKGKDAAPKGSRVSKVKNPEGDRVEVVGVYTEECPEGYGTLEDVLTAPQQEESIVVETHDSGD